MVEWQHEERSDGAETARGSIGRWRLFLIDWKRSDEPVQWFLRFHPLWFGTAEGRARSLDEGKQLVIAAAEAEDARVAAEQAARAAEREGEDG